MIHEYTQFFTEKKNKHTAKPFLDESDFVLFATFKEKQSQSAIRMNKSLYS